MKRITFVFLSSFLISSLLFAGNQNKDQQNTEETLLNGLKSNNIGLQVSSAVMLGEIKSENAVNPLTEVLRNSEDTRARKAAAQSLAKIGTERSLYVVKQAIRFNNDENVQNICKILIYGRDKIKKETGQEYLAAK